MCCECSILSEHLIFLRRLRTRCSKHAFQFPRRSCWSIPACLAHLRSLKPKPVCPFHQRSCCSKPAYPHLLRSQSSKPSSPCHQKNWSSMPSFLDRLKSCCSKLFYQHRLRSLSSRPAWLARHTHHRSLLGWRVVHCTHTPDSDVPSLVPVQGEVREPGATGHRQQRRQESAWMKL